MIKRVNSLEYIGSLIEADGEENHTEVGNGIQKNHKHGETMEGNKQQN